MRILHSLGEEHPRNLVTRYSEGSPVSYLHNKQLILVCLTPVAYYGTQKVYVGWGPY